MGPDAVAQWARYASEQPFLAALVLLLIGVMVKLNRQNNALAAKLTADVVSAVQKVEHAVNNLTQRIIAKDFKDYQDWRDRQR